MPEQLPNRRSRRVKRRQDDIPTLTDNLLYLLAELELAVKRPSVDWSGDLAARIQRRLQDLVELVRQIAGRER